MKRRQFIFAGVTTALSGWLGVAGSRGMLASGLSLRYRIADNTLHVMQEGESTWRVGLRVGDSLRIGRVWETGGQLAARIHHGEHTFVLTSRDGNQWHSH